jgi:hypothetical protein
MILSLASVMQIQKLWFYLLHQRCKHQNDDFASCISDANTKMMVLPLASAMQTPKRLISPLQDCT